MDGLFLASYNIASDLRNCTVALYARLLLVQSLKLLASQVVDVPVFQTADGDVQLSCENTVTQKITTRINFTGAHDFEIFDAFERAQEQLAQNWSSFPSAQSVLDLTVTGSDGVTHVIPDNFVDVGKGQLCNHTNISRIPGRVTIQSCAEHCAATPNCGCMHYATSGNGRCELATTSFQDHTTVAAEERMNGYRYLPLRNITWQTDVRYRTVPLIQSRTCEEIFAESLEKQPGVDIRVYSNNISCHYEATTKSWIANGRIPPDYGLTLYSSQTPFTLYDHMYDVRGRTGSRVTFTRSRHRMAFPVLQNESCVTLFPSPTVDLYIRLNRGRFCRYIKGIDTWKSESLNAGEEFSLYFAGTADEYIGYPPLPQ